MSLCVYVCISVSVYVFVCVYICACMCVCAYMCGCASVSVYICVCVCGVCLCARVFLEQPYIAFTRYHLLSFGDKISLWSRQAPGNNT